MSKASELLKKAREKSNVNMLKPTNNVDIKIKNETTTPIDESKNLIKQVTFKDKVDKTTKPLSNSHNFNHVPEPNNNNNNTKLKNILNKFETKPINTTRTNTQYHKQDTKLQTTRVTDIQKKKSIRPSTVIEIKKPIAKKSIVTVKKETENIISKKKETIKDNSLTPNVINLKKKSTIKQPVDVTAPTKNLGIKMADRLAMFKKTSTDDKKHSIIKPTPVNLPIEPKQTQPNNQEIKLMKKLDTAKLLVMHSNLNVNKPNPLKKEVSKISSIASSLENKLGQMGGFGRQFNQSIIPEKPKYEEILLNKEVTIPSMKKKQRKSFKF